MATPVRSPVGARARVSGAARPAPSPPGRLLGDRGYRLLITEDGTGGSWAGSCALTRWRGDRVGDPDGWFLHLRDLDDLETWSAARRPGGREPEEYRVAHRAGSLAIARRDRGIECVLTVWVDPRGAECRRLVLRNRTRRVRRLDLTAWLEPALEEPAAFESHPAFSKLFLQTEATGGALLVRRRPRAPGIVRPVLALCASGPGALEVETDRARFLGRGGSAERPRALASREPLSGTTGSVLDPVLALRRTLTLEPGGSAELTLALAPGPTAEAARSAALALADPAAARRSRAAAERRARARAAALGLGAAAARATERLGAALLYGDPRLGSEGPRFGIEPGGAAPARALSRLRVEPGDLLVLIEEQAPERARQEIERAAAAWSEQGLEPRLIAIGGPPPAAGRFPIERLEPDHVDPATRAALGAAARLVVSAAGIPDLGAVPPRGAAADVAGGDRSAGDDALARSHAIAVGEAVAGSDASAGGDGSAGGDAIAVGDGSAGATDGEATARAAAAEPLRAWNGIGGFSADGSEYVIRLEPGPGGPRLPPAPWINVLANPGFGCIVSETGAGPTWGGNSRERRLTPWSNDPVLDPPGETLTIRDLESGARWSALPGPMPGPGGYETRHGFGRTRFRHASHGVEVETRVFVPLDEPVKITAVALVNASSRRRRLRLASRARLVLGDRDAAGRTVVAAEDPALDALLARQPLSATVPDRLAFAAAAISEAALSRLDPRGPGGAPGFAVDVDLELEPGERREVAFLLGEAGSRAEAAARLGRLRAPGAVERLEADTVARWAERVGAVTIETPVEALDLVASGWLAYQALACRLWGRTACYQSGGAFGFRDQLQDALAFAATDPALVREQLLLHAAHQFVEGDVLHWWHPPDGRGLRTRFADDRLWLPYAAAAYVAATGDRAVLAEQIGFLEGPPLAAGEDEAFLPPRHSAERADLYEHAGRAIDCSLATGERGLPLFGTGDWNDGMNRVGREGRGESVWMAFFLCAVLDAWMPHAAERGDQPRLDRWGVHRARLAAAIEAAGWDGAWYRRGYYDDGAPLGAADADECRIDALVQAWAALTGVAPAERAAQALDAAERHLISDADALVRLLAPPFDRTPHDPGYIKGYVPGVRENGGQYTHAAVWVAQALAAAGRRDRAARVLEMLSPVAHARDAAAVERYRVEPYVVAADVYGAPPHVGRGGWTWYTGSAGWLQRAIVETLLGIAVEDGRLLAVRPAIPGDWPGYRARFQPLGGPARYEIEVENPRRAGGVVAAASLDGVPIAVEAGAARVTIDPAPSHHRLRVELG